MARCKRIILPVVGAMSTIFYYCASLTLHLCKHEDNPLGLHNDFDYDFDFIYTFHG